MPLTDQKIGTRVRETTARFYGFLKQVRPQMRLAPIISDVPARGGFFRIGDTYPKGEVEDAKGSPTINTWDSAAKEVRTKPRRWTGAMDYQTWLTTNFITGGELDRSIRMSVMKLMHDKAKRAAQMLKDGETATDIFEQANGSASPYFDDDPKFIPGTSKGFVNLFEEDFEGSVANMRSVILDVALAAFDEMEGTLGFMHVSPEEGGQIQVIVPPALRRLAHDALKTAPGSLVIGAETFNLTYKVDPLLGAAQGGSDTEFYVARRDAVFSPLIWGETGPEEFRTTRGEDLTRILFDGDLFQPYYAGEFGYGASFNILKFKHGT